MQLRLVKSAFKTSKLKVKIVDCSQVTVLERMPICEELAIGECSLYKQLAAKNCGVTLPKISKTLLWGTLNPKSRINSLIPSQGMTERYEPSVTFDIKMAISNPSPKTIMRRGTPMTT